MRFDDENKVARVSLRAVELLAILNQREADDPDGNTMEIGKKNVHIESLE